MIPNQIALTLSGMYVTMSSLFIPPFFPITKNTITKILKSFVFNPHFLSLGSLLISVQNYEHEKSKKTLRILNPLVPGVHWKVGQI